MNKPKVAAPLSQTCKCGHDVSWHKNRVGICTHQLSGHEDCECLEYKTEALDEGDYIYANDCDGDKNCACGRVYPHRRTPRPEVAAPLPEPTYDELVAANKAWDIHCAELLEENEKLRKLVKSGR